MDANTLTSADFWKGRRVFVTGHTGFKGSWLCLWLTMLGARVSGYAWDRDEHKLFTLTGAEREVKTVWGDVRNRQRLDAALREATPEIVFHLAAQPLVRASYQIPADTFEVNVMGTVNLLEAVCSAVDSGMGIKAVVNVTTDKCYDNREWIWGYRETDPLGGYDPYSASKACSELVTQAYRSSYFLPARYAEHGVAVATARAGNVIGGGDDSPDRLVPDCLRAFAAGERPLLRSPGATRPWQHVLEPLGGYLLLAEQLVRGGADYAAAWNFGPEEESIHSVEKVALRLAGIWGEGAGIDIAASSGLHEAGELQLDSTKSRRLLGWRSRWSVEQALQKTVEWHRALEAGQDMRRISELQIREYMTENH
ncbi:MULTISPECIES: CDP-glucose 4,6-dehydratase [unclassified Paenibacillus]|uniref:CDP-glucose 4,6-dehydratase n=1 Tax=unclassified Paenibacillus TaxID=185978 RepID=UPI0026C31C48